MSSSPQPARDDDGAGNRPNNGDPNPPTVAVFSPAQSSRNKQRSTILVHQKSPLLIATPPQITRALAYSHPFLLPINKLVGLLTWTTGDPWESFLLVASFWATVLYGDVTLRVAGPLVFVAFLIVGMYARRYSPLSSTGWTGEKLKKGHKREESEATNTKHQKTLDEIVETLKIFTSRCNILLDPLLELTDFLSTQRTATSATTRPALTTLLIRILLVTPFWIGLTLRPIHIITGKRVVLVAGTLFLTWHSRPCRITRTIMWRSATVRRVCSTITGLHFAPVPSKNKDSKPPLPPRTGQANQSKSSVAASTAFSTRKNDSSAVKFTFILYENQRRWVGLGWTSTLFAYERAAWTDEHLNPAPSKEDFELPDVDGGNAKWRWVEGSQWLVEGADDYDEGGIKAKASGGNGGGQGWIYYDNKWQNGKRGQDGWGKYTRRRKWYRDAELIEVTSETESTPPPSPTATRTEPKQRTESNASSGPSQNYSESIKSDAASIRSSKSTGVKSGTLRRRGTGTASIKSQNLSEDENLPSHRAHQDRSDWGMAAMPDDARMGLE